jgi:hypothetical protein
MWYLIFAYSPLSSYKCCARPGEEIPLSLGLEMRKVVNDVCTKVFMHCTVQYIVAAQYVACAERPRTRKLPDGSQREILV